MKRKPRITKRRPSQVSSETEERLLAQTRKSLLAKKGWETHYKIDKTVFEFRKSAPAHMPSEKELKSDLPEAYKQIEILKPATIKAHHPEQDLVTFYFDRERGRFREVFNLTVPAAWDGCNHLQMGQLFGSTLMALCLTWTSQRKFIKVGDAISLRDGKKLDLDLSQPVIYTNKDILEIFYDQPYSARKSADLDAVYRALYALSLVREEKVWDKKLKCYTWQPWYFSRVLNKLTFGSRGNPDLRMVDIDSSYVSTVLKMERLEKEEEIREMLRGQPYHNVAIADVKLDHSFSRDELLLCDFWFGRQKRFRYNPDHRWTFQRFLSEVMGKSDPFIRKLIHNGELKKYIPGITRSLNKKLRAANWPQVGQIKVFPKKSPKLYAQKQTFKFEEPSMLQSST